MKLPGVFHIYVKTYTKDKLTLKKVIPQNCNSGNNRHEISVLHLNFFMAIYSS